MKKQEPLVSNIITIHIARISSIKYTSENKENKGNQMLPPFFLSVFCPSWDWPHLWLNAGSQTSYKQSR